MASEPISIFSRHIRPREVVEAVVSRYPRAVVVGAGAKWTSITVPFGDANPAPSVKLTHDADAYAQPAWSRQIDGMQGYFSRFPSSSPAHRARVQALVASLRFCLGVVIEPDYTDPATDDRFAIVTGVTRMLDGVIFTPSALRDPNGFALIAADQPNDDDAVWPSS